MIQPEASVEEPAVTDRQSRSWFIGLTSFFFILLQSACAAFTTLSGLRLLIGIGSLAAASSGMKFLVALHTDAVRLPMMVLAIAGSCINLYVIWRIRSLRARPASRWRAVPVAPGKKRSESIQVALAVLALFLVTVEIGLHLHLHGSI